ncbi:glycosyltransferase family 61 protein [Luteolibacter algae]|uniref:Glycosyltransferase family 61 protein n=1 Tax=Luteolibacter algae TaxID=454151 RepID=A0ABW5D755_9BACT
MQTIANKSLAKIKATYLRYLRRFDKHVSIIPTISYFSPQSGWFSAFDQFKQNSENGMIISNDQGQGQNAENSLARLYNKNQHFSKNWPFFWLLITNARLVGGLRIWRNTENKGVLEGSFNCTERLGIRDGQGIGRYWLAPERKLPGPWTSIISNWGTGNNYYHWMIDCLGRLAALEHLPEFPKIIIPISDYPFVSESLEMLGLIDRCETHDEPCVRPERFYFISPPADTGKWNPIAYAWLEQKFSPYFSKENGSRRLFFTRVGSNRIPDNISQIENIFINEGFEIIDCGKLTLREQILISSSASIIAGLHGAAMTNILWTKDNTKIIEIFQEDYLNSCYEQIAFYKGIKYNYIINNNKSINSNILTAINS